MTKRKPPGKRKGTKDVHPDETEAMLAAIVLHGSIRLAADALKIDKDKVWRAARDNEPRLRQLRDDAARARERRTAAILDKGIEGVDEALASLRETIADPNASPGLKASAAAGIVQLAALLAKETRLDSGKPTERVHVDDRTNEEIASAARAEALTDPETRAALGLP